MILDSKVKQVLDLGVSHVPTMTQESLCVIASQIINKLSFGIIIFLDYKTRLLLVKPS